MYGRGKKLSKPKKQNKISSIRNRFTLKEKKNEIIDRRIKDRIIRDIFKLFETEEEKKERKKLVRKNNDRLIKDSIVRDIRTLFEQEDDYYYFERKRVSNFLNNNYIEYKSNGNRNKNLSLDKYLDKIEPYLRHVIIDLQNSDT